MYDTIIKNCRVYDGITTEPQNKDIAIADDKIALIETKIDENAKDIVDVNFATVTPGFIDIQNHSDTYWTLFDNPNFESLLTQGITTILIGQCGASLAPIFSSQGLLPVRKWHELQGSNINWQTFQEYLDQLAKQKFGCNIATLVGYSTMRRGLVGDSIRSLDDSEIKILKKQLKAAYDAGAFGMSSGLSYSHEIIISQLELHELATITAKSDRLFSMHLRSEGSEILESLDEVLDFAERAKVNLKISHLKLRGQKNAKFLSEVLEKLETSFHRGANVHFDIYPYDSVWQVAYGYLPKWVIAGGRQNILKHLNNPQDYKKILSELSEHSLNIQKLIIASTGNQLNAVGKSIAHLSKNSELSAEEVFLELIKNAGSESLVFDSCVKPEVLSELIFHPQSIIATDGAGFSEIKSSILPKSKLVHPRCFGAMPRFLQKVISSKKISFGEAIKKITSMPADKLGLKNRGRLKVGAFADIIAFDAENFKDLATLENPYIYSKGIQELWVNGKRAIKQGVLLENRNGLLIRKT